MKSREDSERNSGNWRKNLIAYQKSATKSQLVHWIVQLECPKK